MPSLSEYDLRLSEDSLLRFITDTPNNLVRTIEFPNKYLNDSEFFQRLMNVVASFSSTLDRENGQQSICAVARSDVELNRVISSLSGNNERIIIFYVVSEPDHRMNNDLLNVLGQLFANNSLLFFILAPASINFADMSVLRQQLRTNVPTLNFAQKLFFLNNSLS